ncbi:MAG: hypothetical protein KDF59_03300 [Nitrosomonas sp.]|nr:hypothetical protein [Nitrosomonas sp.]
MAAIFQKTRTTATSENCADPVSIHARSRPVCALFPPADASGQPAHA